MGDAERHKTGDGDHSCRSVADYPHPLFLDLLRKSISDAERHETGDGVHGLSLPEDASIIIKDARTLCNRRVF